MDTKVIKKEKFVGFRVNEEEYDRILLNAQKKNMKISGYCRLRCLSMELNTNETLNFLVMFMNNMLDERGGNGDRTIWTEKKLEETKKRLDLKLQGIVMGMENGEKKEQFIENWNKKTEAYGNIAKDLNEMLSKYYVEH